MIFPKHDTVIFLLTGRTYPHTALGKAEAVSVCRVSVCRSLCIFVYMFVTINECCVCVVFLDIYTYEDLFPTRLLKKT